jgi:hypothetical protein
MLGFAFSAASRFDVQSREISDDMLVVVAPTRGPLQERRFHIGLISKLVLDYQPGFREWLDEELYSVGPTNADGLLSRGEDARSVSLKISTLDGESARFRMIDKIFDRTALHMIVNELARRGVEINRIVSGPD